MNEATESTTRAQDEASAETNAANGAPARTVGNVHRVAQMEMQALQARGAVARLTERVIAAASTSAFTFGHLLWFFAWIVFNTLSPWRFDPFPFNFLILVVSLEAIVLTSFVLRDQIHMSAVSDRRAHLDLQVNLLAEEELTAILRVLCEVATRVGVDPHQQDPELHKLLRRTDVRSLATEIDRELTGGPAAKRTA